MRIISAIGMTAPDSLLTIMMETRIVSGRRAALSVSAETKPASSGCRYVTSEALRFERFHGVQHGVMLDGSGDDVIAALFQALAGRENCPVIRLRAAGGEKTRSGSAPRLAATSFAGVFQLALGGNAQLVDRGGVSPGVAQQARHCLHAGGIWFGGGGIVQIDHRNTSALF